MKDHRQLRNNYSQLCSAFSDLSDRNAILQCELQTSRSTPEIKFHTVSKRRSPTQQTHPSPVDEPQNIPVCISSRFDVLPVEDCDPELDFSDSTPMQSTTQRSSHKPCRSPHSKPGNTSPSSSRTTPTPLPTPASSSSTTPHPTPERVTSSTTSNNSSTASSSSTCTKHTVLIIGDSIPKHLVGRRMSKRVRVINRCIPGTSVELWTKIAPIIVREENASAVIIHCGTNNLQSCYTHECIYMLSCMIKAIQSIKSTIKIAVSSLTVQKKLGPSIWIKEFNARLRSMCNSFNLSYIDNDNIDHRQLSGDGLHLNKLGTSQLARNFINYFQYMDFHLNVNSVSPRIS